MSVNENEIDGLIRVRMDVAELEKQTKAAEKELKRLEKEATASSNRTTEQIKKANQARAQADRRYTTLSGQLAKARVQITQMESKELSKQADVAHGRQSRFTQAQRSGQRITETQVRGQEQRTTVLARGTSALTQQEARRRSQLDIEEARRVTNALKLENEKQRVNFVSELSKRNQANKRALSEFGRDSRAIDAILKRSLQGPVALQAKIASAIAGPSNAVVRQAQMLATGQTRTQVLQSQLTQAGISPAQIPYLLGGGRRPPGFGPPPAGGGFFGGFGRAGGRILGGLASGLGIGVGGMGAYAAVQAAQAVVESTKTATAYDRQRIAADNLAGSTAQLNELLRAYAQASGNAVNKVTSLENVTRLLATGFAKSAPEVEKFVRATRGASIALGRPQEYVIQETQLAISNTSVKRLDQIGLGIAEVNERIEKLRATNKGWTRETAFQDAVIDLLSEKYAHLTLTVEGQATGVEKLATVWADLGLAMGTVAKGPLNALSQGIADMLDMTNNPQTVKNLLEFMNILARVTLISQGRNPNRVFEQNRREIFAERSDDRQINAGIMRASIRSRGTTPGGYSEETMEGIRSFELKRQSIESNYQQERLRATQDYELQRTSIINNYAKQTAREAEDFGRQRANAIRKYDESIVDLLRDSAKQRLQWEKELARNIAKAQEDSAKQVEKLHEDFARRRSRMEEDLQENIAEKRKDVEKREAEMREDYDDARIKARTENNKRLAEIEEQYHENREKSLEDHRDALFSAAAHADAFALFNEQKRWEKENKEQLKAHREALDKERERFDEQQQQQEEAHEKAIADEKKNLQEYIDEQNKAFDKALAREKEDLDLRLREEAEALAESIEQQREAHELRLQEQKENDEERLAEMKRSFDEQIRQEDEERGIRLARQQEDHNDQLEELDRQHGLRMKQIEDNYAKEKAQLDKEIEDFAIANNIYIKGLQEKREEQDKLTIEWFDLVIERLEKEIKFEKDRRDQMMLDPEKAGPQPTPYANGGYVNRTGPAFLHAGEFVMSRGMLAGNSMIPPSVSSAINSSHSMSMGNLSINVYAQPGQSAPDIGAAVRREFASFLQEMNPGGYN